MYDDARKSGDSVPLTESPDGIELASVRTDSSSLSAEQSTVSIDPLLQGHDHPIGTGASGAAECVLCACELTLRVISVTVVVVCQRQQHHHRRRMFGAPVCLQEHGHPRWTSGAICAHVLLPLPVAASFHPSPLSLSIAALFDLPTHAAALTWFLLCADHYRHVRAVQINVDDAGCPGPPCCTPPPHIRGKAAVSRSASVHLSHLQGSCRGPARPIWVLVRVGNKYCRPFHHHGLLPNDCRRHVCEYSVSSCVATCVSSRLIYQHSCRQR
jgi:hypothetical protein